MTMQPQKCCGVHRRREPDRTLQRKHLRVKAQLVSAAVTETGCQKGQPSDHRVTSEEVQCIALRRSSLLSSMLFC